MVNFDDSRESAMKIDDSQESSKIMVEKLRNLENHHFQDSSYEDF